MSYTINYGDTTPLDTVTGETIPYHYNAAGTYVVTIDASNDLPGVSSSTVTVMLEENIDGIMVSEVQATTLNETKDFDVTVASLGTRSCLVIDYDDATQEIFGDRPTCENHANYPSATYVHPLTNSFRVTHVYTSLGSFRLIASGFNRVSDASATLFFAVSDFSCNSPRLFIRDSHPDWRGPRVAHFNEYLQIQGVTSVECQSYENQKVWELEEVDPQTGLAIPGTATRLTGLPPTHRFYLPDAHTAEINIPPWTIPLGTWKFKYTVHMDRDTPEDIDYVAFANEYVQIRSSPLTVQIIEGQTTSKVIGHGLAIRLQPGVLSRDPDLPDDVTDQNFTSIEYFCRRFYEPWKLDDQREIDKSYKIPVGVPNSGDTEDGGCFGTGSGLLDYEDDVLDLDTTHTLPNMAYEIMVIVTKGPRRANASIYFTVKPGNPPQASISCSGGTLFESAYASLVVNPTDDFRLRASCETGCDDAVYRWDMDYFNESNAVQPVTNWEQHATGVLTDSLYINKDVFTILPDVYTYLFTLYVTNKLGQSGKAHTRVVLNKPPEGGVCTITPSEVTVGNMVDIVCSDWEDEHGIANYEFFVQADSNTVNKVVGFGNLPGVRFFPPLGKAEDNYIVKFGVQIDDILGATTIHNIGSIRVRPSNISTSEFLSEENTVNAERRFKTLAAEGNSRAINNVILTESSRLNDIRSVEVRAFNASNATSEEESPAENVMDTRLYEAGRTKRAYWRKNMAELQTETSLDSLGDVLYSATAATVLTEATDELSHDALSSMTNLGGKMVRTLKRLAKDTDQKTLIKTSVAIYESLTNMLEGSAKTIDEPLWLLDQFEEAGSVGGFSSLNQDIQREIVQSEDMSRLTTENTVTEKLKEEKEKKAHSVVSQTNLLIAEVANIMKENKLPREPPSLIKTKTASMTLSRNEAAVAVQMAVKEGEGAFNLPSWCSLKGQKDCDKEEIIDVQSNSFLTNHYNYMDSSERISDKSNIMALKFEDQNGKEINIGDSLEEIEIWIPRPNSKTPQCHSYEQNFNTTSQSGMSLHTFHVPFDQTTVTLEVLPEEFFSVQYGLLLRYKHPPSRDEYDHLWILPYNISLGANVSDYTVYLNETYIANRTGTYYLGIVELPQAPQGDLPDTVFDDHLSPREVLDDILRMHRVFNFTGNYTLCVYVSGCAYFNNLTQEWSTEGVRVGPKTTKDLTQCFSRHLTDFASTWIVPPTPLDFEYIFNNAGFLENLTIYITTIAIYVLFAFIFIWARRKDRKDIIMQGLTPLADNKPKDKYLYEIAVMTGQWKGSGTDSKVHFILSGEDDETEVRMFEDDKRPILQTGSIDRFVMAVPRPLGTLNYMRLWHDNSGKGAMQNWFLSYAAVRDLQTRQRFYFIANRWFSLVDDDGQVDRLLPVAGREQMQGFSHVFSSHTRKNLNDGHLWFSIFLRPVGSRFTRVQRTACCLMALWLEMLVNIMWYKVVPPATSSSAINIGPFSLSPAQISIGVQSSIIVFPITLLVVQIFRKVRPRRRQKSHRRIIKEQQEELRKKYKVGKEDVISPTHVVMENRPATDVEDTISTRSEVNLLDNQADEAPIVTIRTTASNPPQKPSAQRKKRKFSLPWWVVIIGWILCILSIVTATVFTVFYGISFGDQTTKEWLTSLVISFITGILFTQPIKILLVAMFIALIIKSPNADEEEGDVEEDEEDKELGKDEMWLHDFSSPTQRKIAYKPPDPADLERIREQRMKELKMYNILREIAFYIVFLWTLMVFSYSNVDPFAFYMKDQFVNTLNNGDGINTFNKVSGIKHFWRWVDTGLVPNLYADRWYNGKVDPHQAGFFGDRQSFILGKVVMRQLRIKPGLCDVHESFEEIVPECNEEYSLFNEDTADYGRAWQTVNDSDETAESYRYIPASELEGYPFLGKHALYGGGGYVVVVDGSQHEMRQMFRRLYNETWIDRYTRAVFIEFSCYNPHVNLFAVVCLTAEFLQTGAGQPTHRVDIIRLLTYAEGFGLVRIICEVMFFCFILFFIVKEVRNARRERRQYLRNFWNWTECAIIGFSVGAAIIYFYRLYITNGLLARLKEGGYRYIKLQYIAYWNELLGYMLGWIVFLASLKFLKLLRFNRRIGVLSSTIHNCSSDLMYFGIMFGIVFFAFATAFYLIFGSNVYDYSDFIYTCESLIAAILGKFKFKELMSAQKALGPFFFFSFMMSMSYILINMFLTIINEAFKIVNADISKQSNEYEMVDFMIRRLKLWTGLGKPPAIPGDRRPGEGDEDGGPKKEQDLMDEFPEKVDQLLNSIAKIYFNHESFDEVIRGMGQNGKKEKGPKKTISV
ncbi:polycystic kidney disease protein 1-like 2 [Acanthaster planci]|uniref:Polycystic kidney disease protein 1-like 2 n=1 Tax=Acanthaster planci TaxID=133434 RepID=A0A8B7ZWV0_ACAPL|nr:polycystic kidney disease protein 1-like 2 [Acanthaster planci]